MAWNIAWLQIACTESVTKYPVFKTACNLNGRYSNGHCAFICLKGEHVFKLSLLFYFQDAVVASAVTELLNDMESSDFYRADSGTSSISCFLEILCMYSGDLNKELSLVCYSDAGNSLLFTL